MQNASPLYKRIATMIKDEITKLGIKKDEAIPAENKLALKYGVSRVTIRQAIDLLVSENILYKIQGSGTYVKQSKIDFHLYKLQSFTEEVTRLNRVPTNTILDFKMIGCNDLDGVVIDALKIGAEDKVFYIRRLRSADQEPMILEETYLPVKLFPDLSLEIMSKSKYQYIESKGFQINQRVGEVAPILPDKGLMDILQLQKPEPILVMKVWSNLVDETVFEYTVLYFRSDKYTFKFSSDRI